jgi:hypothetical protein
MPSNKHNLARYYRSYVTRYFLAVLKYKYISYGDAWLGIRYYLALSDDEIVALF